MKMLARIILSFFAFIAVFFFLYWVLFAVLARLFNFSTGNQALQYVSTFISLLLAVYTAVFIWNKLKGISKGWASYMLTGGIILGSIGFISGFFGPLIFHPEGNQGPLLGILITGPAGFLLGLLGGAILMLVRVIRNRKEKQTQPPVPEE
jgi:hypothetical protein